MIKVLEHGVRKITCPCCKAKLQYEQEDISENTNIDNILGVDTKYKYITCPDCGIEIVLTPLKK